MCLFFAFVIFCIATNTVGAEKKEYFFFKDSFEDLACFLLLLLQDNVFLTFAMIYSKTDSVSPLSSLLLQDKFNL